MYWPQFRGLREEAIMVRQGCNMIHLKIDVSFSRVVLLLTMNFIITLSKQSADPLSYPLMEPQLQYFDNVA